MPYVGNTRHQRTLEKLLPTSFTGVHFPNCVFQSAIVLCNIAYRREDYAIKILEYGGLEKFLQLLKSPSNELICLALQFLEMMLRTLPGSREGFEKMDGVAYLEALQFNKNEEICQYVNDLMVNYFEGNDDV